MTIPDSELLSVPQASVEFRVSKPTLWRMISRGELKAFRANHRRETFIRRDDLRAAFELKPYQPKPSRPKTSQAPELATSSELVSA